MADSDQEPQKDFPSNPPNSGAVKEISQRTNHKADGQKRKEKSRKTVEFQPSERNSELRSPHSRDEAN
jgi:hypothetical protein